MLWFDIIAHLPCPMIHDFQVLSDVHSALTDSIATQKHKLAETRADAQSARNDANLAKSKVNSLQHPCSCCSALFPHLPCSLLHIWRGSPYEAVMLSNLSHASLLVPSVPLTAANKRCFQKGESGQRIGDSICTGGAQADTASDSAGKASPGRLACLLLCHVVLIPRVSLELLVAGSQCSVSDILAIAGDILGEVLDKQEGHTVTDKNIYRYITLFLHMSACFLAPGASG